MDISNLAKLVVFLPLISGVYNGLVYALNKRKNGDAHAAIISCLFMVAASICALILFLHAGVDKNTVHVTLGSWLGNLNSSSLQNISINWAIYVDSLTAIMFVLVTLVSSVVHIYSVGYMRGDDNLPKFLSYLSLFTFFMLALVSADNFLQLFFGWEGVGLCSYLLIGYYFTKSSANDASIKAFIVNRVGDCALVIGMAMLYLNLGNLEFVFAFAGFDSSEILLKLSDQVLSNSYFGDISKLDIICLLLFIGCMGKSAQIGLHVWLPDAMEGPTPVSALIHAATMVTAGVFLLARCSFLFEHSPLALSVITVVGAVTCLFAASVAIAQDDIKKIIAYSTCSQLGYMFFACGVSAYQAGVFHLVTHGFFKALLFLSAGSVIHAAHEQDLFKIRDVSKGSMAKKMPITYMNFWIGSLAIIGIFPFAGFYSKDLILESAYAAGESGSFVANFAFVFGIIAAVITAIYSLKIILLVFHNKGNHSSLEDGTNNTIKDDHNNVTRNHGSVNSTGTKSDSHTHHIHESPLVMNLPLFLLLAGALFSGMIGFYVLNISDLHGYFQGSIYKNPSLSSHEHNFALIIKILPLVAGILGMIIGYFCYKGAVYRSIASKMGIIFRILKNKYYFDEFYGKTFIKFTNLTSYASNVIDKKLIDRYGPDGVSYFSRIFGWCISQIHTGYIFNYALYIVLSLIICVSIFIWDYYQQIPGW